MLSSFVSPRTAAIAAATPSGTTRVEREPGAVLFADISGFTRLGEELAAAGRDGAELLSGAISSCFAALIDVVLAHGGDVLRFGGDALAGFFAGLPDTAGRTAAACAVEMQRVMISKIGRAHV